MLTAGMPVSSLRCYLGPEHIDTTMIYTEVSDPLLKYDYYQGIAALDPGSENFYLSGLAPFHHQRLRQLVDVLKIPDLEQSRHDEIWISSWRISVKIGGLCISKYTLMLRCTQ